MSEKSRSALFETFSSIAGEEPVGEMLSHFPARDVEEPVTKEVLRAEMADLRLEMADLRTELRTEMADLRTELRLEMAALRAELRLEMAALRTELRAELQSAMNQQLRWMVGTMIAIAMVTVSLVALIG